MVKRIVIKVGNETTAERTLGEPRTTQAAPTPAAEAPKKTRQVQFVPDDEFETRTFVKRNKFSEGDPDNSDDAANRVSQNDQQLFSSNGSAASDQAEMGRQQKLEQQILQAAQNRLLNTSVSPETIQLRINQLHALSGAPMVGTDGFQTRMNSLRRSVRQAQVLDNALANLRTKISTQTPSAQDITLFQELQSLRLSHDNACCALQIAMMKQLSQNPIENSDTVLMCDDLLKFVDGYERKVEAEIQNIGTAMAQVSGQAAAYLYEMKGHYQGFADALDAAYNELQQRIEDFDLEDDGDERTLV